ncbi:M48 family metalloprotease [Ramlibacter sp. 2FC]|uniref:M48 family metalloprotease n=1 Tax=Ramlibacter sp. 2FC TaxID=2502188 RepID=UPI0010F73327|nr:M48 family metalloprotease [Ramlibacter sp. 2FC]
MTLGAERKLGERIARELYRDPDYLDDAVLAEYVQGLWQPLLAAARQRGELTSELEERFAWEILLGRDRTINAFALPGGYLGVHLGLIGAVTRRDELAAVLAHELSHVTQRHISRLIAQQDRQAPWLLGAMILGALAASKNPQAAQAVVVGGQAVAAQSQLNFSRDMEREADRIGFGVLTQAGFAAEGFVGMFEKLQQASRLNDNGAFPYLRSHPLTTERIADMQARQPLGAPRAAPPPDLEQAMVAARARVLARPGVDVLRGWVAEAETPGFAGLAVPRRAAVLYAAALASLQLNDLPRAAAFAARLVPLAAAQPQGARQARLLGAEVALQAGDLGRAAQLLGASGDASPARPELFLWAQLRTRGGQAAEAAARLQPWVLSHPRDASAWQLLAAAHAAQGQGLRAIRAEGEARLAQLDYAAAVDRFRAAQALYRQGPGQPGDHIEASIVDTRLRLAESALREQALER